MTEQGDIEMADLFPTGMSFFWRPENDGQGFHDDPRDPGGATSWGVTLRMWNNWLDMHGSVTTVVDDFARLLKEGFLPFYRAQYWNSVRCGNMGPIGIQVFDASANAGPGHAARFLQTVLGVEVDGELGPQTLKALNNADPLKVNLAFCTTRERYYNALPGAKYFGKGWDRRAEDCRAFVETLIRKNY